MGSYIVFNQSNYFNLDTLPLNLPPPQQSKIVTRESKEILQYLNIVIASKDSISHQQHKEGIFLLNEEQVSTKLRQFEESYTVNRGKGVTRYDICQLPSNSPLRMTEQRK